jgi:hypothetical protein
MSEAASERAKRERMNIREREEKLKHVPLQTRPKQMDCGRSSYPGDRVCHLGSSCGRLSRLGMQNRMAIVRGMPDG